MIDTLGDRTLEGGSEGAGGREERGLPERVQRRIPIAKRPRRIYKRRCVRKVMTMLKKVAQSSITLS
jgi:hypothetical protein